MTSRESLAGGVLMVGLPGTALDRVTAKRIQELAPAGVILFRRNLASPEQTALLLDELRCLLPSPTLLALDQEGGRVSRLEPWIGPTPAAAALGRAGEGPAREFGKATGTALSSLGFNVDFAPVVDLCEPDAANGIGDRAWSTDPGVASRLAGAFLAGLQGSGVAGCLKHFPGLGDSHVDSHVSLPTVDRSLERIEREDLRPYRELGPGAACVMVGHGHYPALDPRGQLPASCSPRVVDGLLKGRLGYSGLVVSDDLEMGAVSERDREGAVAAESLAAGCDLLLFCHDLERAATAAKILTLRAERDPLVARRLESAAAAVRRTAERWPAPVPRPEAWAAAGAAFEPFSNLA
jgi:beta-N-acetylhexosaminidase